MVLTRQEARDAFIHVVDNVLESTTLKEALARDGISDIIGLCQVNEANIIGFHNLNASGKPTFLSNGDKGMMRTFIQYIHWLNISDTPINDNWMEITQAGYDEFRCDPAHIGINATINDFVAHYAQFKKQRSPSAPPTLSAAAIFKRGIKRDPQMFPELKDEKYNDQWHRSFINQARAQDLFDVLDSQYIPLSADEADLFEEKQKYMYALLETKVKTDSGKSIIRQYESTFNAQQAYAALTAFHLTSSKASMASSSLLTYITSSKITDGDWKGSTETYLLNWHEQIRMYERLMPNALFSDQQKRSMLQNAVQGVDSLRQVQHTADLLAVSGQYIDYASYFHLLLTSACVHDNHARTNRQKRQVLQHELEESTEDIDDDPRFHIDTNVDVIQAFAMNRGRPLNRNTGPKRVLMPRDKWFALDQDSKDIWDKLTEQAKSIILGTTVAPRTNTRFPPRQSGAPSFTPKHQVNLHDISAHEYLNNHFEQQTEDTCNDTDEANGNETLLINATSTNNSSLKPTDIKRVLSQSSTRFVNSTKIIYTASNHKTATSQSLSLVDRGANGGVAGSDVRIIFKTGRSVDIKGIDNHHCNDIDIGTVGGVVQSHKGPIIAILHQYALLNKGPSIHSPAQLEWYKNDVNDKSALVPGGLQRIQTLDGYILPLIVKDGLARIQLRPFSDHEWDNLPHVILTSELEWDPAVLDHEFPDDEQWGAIDGIETSFNDIGDYKHCVTVNHIRFFDRQDGSDIDSVISNCVLSSQLYVSTADQAFYDAADKDINEPHISTIDAVPRTIMKKAPDFNALRPMFGWFDSDIIKNTFKHTTQYGRLPMGTLLKKAFKSPNPALNVFRRNEDVACDTVYSDTPAVFSGAVAAVIFVGTSTQVTDVYGIKTDKQFVNTLQDNIIDRGAPNKLISDRAQVIVSNKVTDILRTLCIKQWQSEPHQQHQNAAERRYQTLKSTTNRILDRTGAPASTWLLCLQYSCFLLNHTYNMSIHGIPLTQLSGTTVDISPLLRFHFWQPVYYKEVDSCFPSESKESLGNIVGISEHCGNAMTWKVLTPDTQVVLYRSILRPVTPDDPNLRANMICGEISDNIIDSPICDAPHLDTVLKSRHDIIPEQVANQVAPKPMFPTPSPVFNPSDLVGKTFLMDKQKDGQQHRARIVELLDDHVSKLEDNPTRIKFKLSVNNDTYNEIISYNQLLEYISKDIESDIVWKFRRIISHHGPLAPNHKDYKGCNFNILIEWENGETTMEPLNLIAADDPISCALYAKEHGLLNTSGWKRFKNIAKNEKKLQRMVNQVKLKSFNTSPKYKYGYEIPRSYDHAISIDRKNGNTLWGDAIALELDQINEYETFIDKGHHTRVSPPSGYKKIRVHFVFDVKHDGRHKARLVADGHLTEIPLESVYSGVVSLRGFRLVLFIAELNSLIIWTTDIGNAYLEAFTSECVYIIAGPEFGILMGHILIISRALYGLRSSGARWHDRFSDCIRELGFWPCKAEPDIWMRKVGNSYEYVAVYVDDLAIAMKNPQEIIDLLENKYKFILKGTGLIKYHLGMDFSRDDDGTLCLSPTKYIEKLIMNYERLFGCKPKEYASPLEKGDHPEIDISDLVDQRGIEMYQSMIGALQWIVSIGRLDIMTAVMTMSGFRIAPRKGHIERLRRIYGYLSKMRFASIRIRTEEPDYSDIPTMEYDWSNSVYGNVKEILPTDAPESLGKPVTLTHYVDANLMHDVTSGKSVTGILHLINKTPIEWYSKKQATVETATYGSEFVAARTCVEQIIDLRNTLRYLGVPVRGKSFMFGDNKSVVDSSMTVHAKLHKRHTMLCFHRVREAVASGMIGFYFVPGADNPADILSKHWGYTEIKDRLKAILFWKGDTATINA